MCYSLSVLLLLIDIQNHGLNDTFAEEAYKQHMKIFIYIKKYMFNVKRVFFSSPREELIITPLACHPSNL